MITDEHRGLALELSLTKLLQSQGSLQIIGMSATIGGIFDLEIIVAKLLMGFIVKA